MSLKFFKQNYFAFPLSQMAFWVVIKKLKQSIGGLQNEKLLNEDQTENRAGSLYILLAESVNWNDIVQVYFNVILAEIIPVCLHC